MKTIKDKEILVAADPWGYPLKESVVKHLEERGWKVTDVGAKSENPENAEMFHRIGVKAGSMIAEGEFERALLFCGTGMGIHIAASKCPHVHAAVVESVQAAERCIVGNNCNVMAMGSGYVAPDMANACVDAYLNHQLGDGNEDWENFYEFHKLAYDELEAFDYDAYKKSGFQFPKLGEVKLGKAPIR